MVPERILFIFYDVDARRIVSDNDRVIELCVVVGSYVHSASITIIACGFIFYYAFDLVPRLDLIVTYSGIFRVQVDDRIFRAYFIGSGLGLYALAGVLSRLNRIN